MPIPKRALSKDHPAFQLLFTTFQNWNKIYNLSKMAISGWFSQSQSEGVSIMAETYLARSISCDESELKQEKQKNVETVVNALMV